MSREFEVEDKWQHCTVDFGSEGPSRYYSYCSNQQFINLFSYIAKYIEVLTSLISLGVGAALGQSHLSYLFFKFF